jgi:hypothetical protein
MHPELQPYLEEYAAKERASHEAWNELQKTSKTFMTADPGLASYYEISSKHGRTFQAWVDSNRALQLAARNLHLKAADLANLPLNHPLRKPLT